MDKHQIADRFKQLQDSICQGLELLDGGAVFREDNWDRAEGGGGRSRVIANGKIIEKGGVNFSAVHGPLPDKIKEKLKISGSEFFATGVSIVLHPENPFIPIIHMNVRYFEIPNETWWFGGGIDVTPHYVVPEDAGFFHHELKKVCDKYDDHYYSKFKKWADDYFFIKHRNETRGVGGIFFDRLNTNHSDNHAFVIDLGELFVPIYKELCRRVKPGIPTPENKKWQSLRRSRYVEFNLVWDAGTKFGLDTNGRTESILMSMPPMAQWEYDYQPSDLEKDTLNWLKKDVNWLEHN